MAVSIGSRGMYSLGHHSWIPMYTPHPGHINTYSLVISELAYLDACNPKYARASRFAFNASLRYAFILRSLRSLYSLREFSIYYTSPLRSMCLPCNGDTGKRE